MGVTLASAPAAPAARRATASDPDLRPARARGLVLDLIATRGSGHFTAPELVSDARARGIRVGRATVFRTLDLLLARGAIERLDLPHGEHAYVACRPAHHHHVVCMGCGRAVDVGDGDLREMVRAVEDATGFAVDGHRLELYGRCPRCRTSRPS